MSWERSLVPLTVPAWEEMTLTGAQVTPGAQPGCAEVTPTRAEPRGFLFSVTENYNTGISLVVQWLRLQGPTAGGPGSIPGQGTRPQMLQLKIPRATTETEDPNC